MEGRGAGPHPDRFSGVDVTGEGPLELLDFAAQDEARPVEHALDRTVDVRSDRRILGLQVDQRNLHVRPHDKRPEARVPASHRGAGTHTDRALQLP